MKTVNNNTITNTTTNKHYTIKGKYILSHLLLCTICLFFGAILIKMDIYNINDIIDNNINMIEYNLRNMESITDQNNINNRRRLTTVAYYDGRSSTSDIIGTVVAIRSRFQGLLQNPSSTNRVKTHDSYDDNRVLWIASQDYTKGAYYFENLEDGCYLKSKDGFLKCLDTLDDKALWDEAVTSALEVDESSYRREYGRLKNYDDNKCPRVGHTTNSNIGMSTSNCGDSNAYFTFEIVEDLTVNSL